MRIVHRRDSISVEAEVDGEIAVGFPNRREAVGFVDRVAAAQAGVFC